MIGLIQILGGLALFLYGIQMLTAGIEKLAGDQIQLWLDRVTNNRFKSAAFGAIATALVQSSSLLMVTMIGLINANIMSVEQAIGVMLGQEIGTTMTGQLVAFDIGDYRLILVVIGLVFMEFFPKRDWKKYGEIFLGIGILFIGMGFMSSALGSLVVIPWVKNGIILLCQNVWLGILTGAVLTAITQSSSAVTSLVIAMGISGVISLQGAIGIILGANIGTCITGLIASLRLSPTARQASLAQIIINISGVLVFLPFINPFADLVQHTATSLPRQIANAHTIFNVAVSLLLFPFINQIAGAVKKFSPVKPEKLKKRVTLYIDEKQFAVPSVAINQARREFFRLGEITSEMITLSCQALISKNVTDAERVIQMEDEIVDAITDELENFLMDLMEGDLSYFQQRRTFQVKSLLVDLERVGDMAEDIAQYAQDRAMTEIPFSEEATKEFEMLWRHVHNTYNQSLIAFRDNDRSLAEKVCEVESEFDTMYLEARQRHIQRLEEGTCRARADVIFTETLRLLERISDHADNLAVSVIRN